MYIFSHNYNSGHDDIAQSCLCNFFPRSIDQQEISIGNFSYATGRNITETIQLQLKNSTFSFNGVSVRFSKQL